MSAPILIYGANGYTGRLVAQQAVERGLRPILAGRNADAVGEVARRLDLPHLAVNLDDMAGLEAALRGRVAVIHCAGPFIRTSRPMANACLRMGVHYIDITGEIAVFEELHARDGEARAAGIMLLPGAGFDVVPSDCLAVHLKRRLPEATHLALAFQGLGGISRGTALTALESLDTMGAVRRDGVIVTSPLGELRRQVDFGRGPVDVVAIPWGDVSSAYYSTGIPNIIVYAYIGRFGALLAGQGQLLAPALGARATRRFLRWLIRRGPDGPSDAERARGQGLLWGEVIDAAGRIAISRLRTPEAYTLTAATAVLIAEKVLAGQAPPGFQTPALAYGPDLIMEIAGVERTDLELQDAPDITASPPPEPALPVAAPVEAEQDELAIAEEALARLEDRIGAFTAYTIASDFLELQEIYRGSFERLKEEDWNRRIERRTEAWTMRQALAHTLRMTELYNQVIQSGLEGRPTVIPGLARREDILSFNDAAVATGAERPVGELISAFLEALGTAARMAAPLGAESLGRLVAVPLFSRAPTVAELFGCSLANAGIVRGAHLAVSRSRPIWIFFSPGMMRRQLTRFFHLLGLAYWPERGGDLYATIAINVEGQGGGSWHVRIGPEGGIGKIGRARTTDVTFTFASADLLCRLLTGQTRPWRHIVMRRMHVSGNLGLARRVPGLFALP
ncbi:MAG: saccharopine dehydrogenase NADP-binding domain-containing protein [Oscillochloridaceae bacterium]|nr:saccharopine dehydrogenase NADP-binding domain-containing protein [Chloroflexaceae bacterium]MDW8389545.1 saccharopine dehydrogenase NADP-binding domain-containing protein [Oscillochloridaceae bacterium]